MSYTVKWFEIIASDFERAVSFYQSLFGIELEKCICGEEKMAFFPGKTGSISTAPGFLPSEQGVVIYFNSDDLDKILSKVEKLGGKIIWGKTKIEAEGKGSFILVSDSEGNRIGFHSDN